MYENILNTLHRIGERLNRPILGTFFLYLTLLWLLNIADLYQTALLSHGGFLKKEANFFMDYFLAEGMWTFIVAKLLALVLITAMLVRGYIDRKGTTISGVFYSPDTMRKAINFLLMAGILYYLLIVLFPLATILYNVTFH